MEFISNVRGDAEWEFPKEIGVGDNLIKKYIQKKRTPVYPLILMGHRRGRGRGRREGVWLMLSCPQLP